MWKVRPGSAWVSSVAVLLPPPVQIRVVDDAKLGMSDYFVLVVSDPYFWVSKSAIKVCAM